MTTAAKHDYSAKTDGSQADIIARNLAGVEDHFHAEDSSSLNQAMELFTDDCVWEAPNPIGLHQRVEGKEALRPFYEKLFSTMKDVIFQICFERFATADRVIDDSVCTFEVAADGIWPYPVGTQVFMRIVHVFDMRDGKISKEKVFEMRRPASSHEELMQMVEEAKVGRWMPGRMNERAKSRAKS